MALIPTYTVRAEVLDASKYQPVADEVFVVDTNVWKWLAYTKWSLPSPLPYQATTYPSFIQRIRSAGAALLHCGLTLSELANIIERAEFDQYVAVNQVAPANNLRKSFRRDATERARVSGEIAAAWAQVQSFSGLHPVAIDSTCTTNCLTTLNHSPIDPYDGFIVEATRTLPIPQMLTDDSDLATVSGIRVFTCNNYIIREARAAGMLRQA